jgi:hypothetical protein
MFPINLLIWLVDKTEKVLYLTRPSRRRGSRRGRVTADVESPTRSSHRRVSAQQVSNSLFVALLGASDVCMAMSRMLVGLRVQKHCQKQPSTMGTIQHLHVRCPFGRFGPREHDGAYWARLPIWAAPNLIKIQWIWTHI